MPSPWVLDRRASRRGEDVSDEGGVLDALGLATTSAAEHHVADHDNVEERDATAEPTVTPTLTPVEANAPNPAADIRVDSPQANGRLFASPLARKLARDNNLELDTVEGTGPVGASSAETSTSCGKVEPSMVHRNRTTVSHVKPEGTRLCVLRSSLTFRTRECGVRLRVR